MLTLSSMARFMVKPWSGFTLVEREGQLNEQRSCHETCGDSDLVTMCVCVCGGGGGGGGGDKWVEGGHTVTHIQFNDRDRYSHSHTHTCTYTHTYVHTHKHTHTHTHINKHTQTPTHTHRHTPTVTHCQMHIHTLTICAPYSHYSFKPYLPGQVTSTGVGKIMRVNDCEFEECLRAFVCEGDKEKQERNPKTRGMQWFLNK